MAKLLFIYAFRFIRLNAIKIVIKSHIKRYSNDKIIFIQFTRMGIESTSKMRRHENTSSSEEDDLVDLLGSTTYQVI